MTFNQGPCI